MKKGSMLFFASAILSLGWISHGEAAVMVVGGPGVTFTQGQPIQAVFVDSAGNTIQQTVYYNEALGGIDLNANLIGANTSVYFPSLGAGYVWYDGHWVDQSGYYWNGTTRVYVNHPHWGTYWGGYWHGRSHWDGNWHAHPDVSIHVHESVYEHGHHHYR